MNELIFQWDLVCDRSSSVTLAQTMVMFSFCFGSFVSGPVADMLVKKSISVIFC